ncbi:hypothetical protein H4582DRAFT_2064242 [Lactarius indigo]|nr:hypothetical protein H4582DRAFT_2064242 [Lactarius indigo]
MSSQPAGQTTIESRRILTTPDAPASHTLQEIIDATTPFRPPSFSASSPPSTSPPSAVAVSYDLTPWTPSVAPDIPPSPPTAFLDNMLPAGPHSSILTPASPGPSPRLISALDPGAVDEEEGSTHTVGSREDKDALDPSVIHENIMAAPDISTQSPSAPSVTGVAIAGPSRGSRALDVEHTEDLLPHPLHGQHGIV